MKLVKRLGFAMVAAIAAMAFAGVGSASADVLCKSNVSPCGAANHYANGGVIEAEAEEVRLVGLSGYSIGCRSRFEGELTEAQTTTSGVQAIGTLTELALGFGANACTLGCKVTVLQLPYRFHLKAKGGGNGEMWIERDTVAHPNVNEDPGFTLSNCTSNLFYYLNECTFKVTETQPGHLAGEGAKLVVSGGEPMTIAVNALLQSTCVVFLTWKGTYFVTAPVKGWVI